MDEIDGGPSRGQVPVWLRWVVGGVLLAAVGVGVWQVVGSTSSPTTSPSASPRPRSSTEPTPVVGLSALTCQRGTTSVNPPGTGVPRAAGLASDGWSGTLQPDVQKDGVYFQKAFLYATPRATLWTKVAVESPSIARMYYVGAADWTGQQTQPRLAIFDVGAGQRAVSFQYCGDHPQGYFGGLISEGPACVVLAVRPQASGAVAKRVRVPIGKPCA